MDAPTPSDATLVEPITPVAPNATEGTLIQDESSPFSTTPQQLVVTSHAHAGKSFACKFTDARIIYNP